MSIKNASVLLDGTVATTGGTATPVTVRSSNGPVKAFLDDGSEFAVRKDLEFSVKEPKPSESAPNGYTQAREVFILKVPLLLDNGKITVNTLKIEMATDVETTDAERLTMRSLGAQALSDSDFTGFWDDQATE